MLKPFVAVAIKHVWLRTVLEEADVRIQVVLDVPTLQIVSMILLLNLLQHNIPGSCIYVLPFLFVKNFLGWKGVEAKWTDNLANLLECGL